MTIDHEPLKQHLRAVLADLEALRDEIRLDLHLASMDARDRWRELEPHLDQARVRAREVSKAAGEELADLARRARAVRDAIKASARGNG
jgi:hypothetical protein